MPAELTREAPEIEIPTGPETRLLIKRWDAPTGRSFVQVVPEYLGRDGEWKLKRSATDIPVALTADVAAALVAVGEEVG